MEAGRWVRGPGGHVDEHTDGVRDGLVLGAAEASERHELGGEEVQDPRDDAGAGDLGNQGLKDRRVWRVSALSFDPSRLSFVR